LTRWEGVILKQGKRTNKPVVGLLVTVLLLTIFPTGGCQQRQEKQQISGADFSATTTAGTTPLTVQFTNESKGEIAGCWWFFGDGQSSTEKNPSHTYTADGVYTVSLLVIRGDEWETKTKNDYIRAGSPAPLPILRVQGDGIMNQNIPPQGEFAVLDLAGQGIVYWTSFRVADKVKSDSGVTMAYEHSIWIDGHEAYGDVDQVLEIWNFQQKKVRRPDAFYPAINYLGETTDTMAIAFWRINVPFHDSLIFMPENNHTGGTVWIKMASITYGLVVSGELGQGGVLRGQQWTIEKVKDSVGFPVAVKIKTALEEEFGEKVFSVAIVRYRAQLGAGDLNKVLYVDAPELTREELRTFLEQEFVDFVIYE